MNALIRQLAVLAVLWAAVEMLLPAGRQQTMVRAAVSALVMTALLSAAGGWLHGENAALPAAVQTGLEVSHAQYQRTALSAYANQAQRWCVQFLRRAGYEGEATVYLRLDGAVERIELTVRPLHPLMTCRELRKALGEQLQIDAERIVITEEA